MVAWILKFQGFFLFLSKLYHRVDIFVPKIITFQVLYGSFSIPREIDVLEVDAFLQLNYKLIPNILNVVDYKLKVGRSFHRSSEMLLL